MQTILNIPSIQALPGVAKQFIEITKDYKLFAFYGKMGAGKTTFIKEVVKQLGSNDIVNSPTFSIVNEYDCIPTETNNQTKKIYHFDFYRINKIEEAFDMGYDEYFESGNPCFIEWPELIEPLLPNRTLRILIEENENKTRTIRIEK